MGDLAVAFHLLVEDPPPHAVKAHGDDLVPLRPTDGAILGVAFHRPLTRDIIGGTLRCRVTLTHMKKDSALCRKLKEQEDDGSKKE